MENRNDKGAKRPGYSGYGGSKPRGSYPDKQDTFSVKAVFPKDYLANGYRTEDGKLDTRYLTSYAKQIGEGLSSRGEGKTGSSKIRSFYDEVVAIRDMINHNEITFDRAVFRLLQLPPRVTARRKKGNASVFFENFIHKNIDAVTNDGLTDAEKRDRLNTFVDHFEAVICFAGE